MITNRNEGAIQGDLQRVLQQITSAINQKYCTVQPIDSSTDSTGKVWPLTYRISIPWTEQPNLSDEEIKKLIPIDFICNTIFKEHMQPREYESEPLPGIPFVAMSYRRCSYHPVKSWADKPRYVFDLVFNDNPETVNFEENNDTWLYRFDGLRYVTDPNEILSLQPPPPPIRQPSVAPVPLANSSTTASTTADSNKEKVKKKGLFTSLLSIPFLIGRAIKSVVSFLWNCTFGLLWRAIS